MFLPLLRSTKTFPRGLEQRRRQRKGICFLERLRFRRNTRVAPPVRRLHAIRQKHLDCSFTPPPSPPSPPPLPPPSIDSDPVGELARFVEECLNEAPATGECTTWASGNNYGTIPNWDTSLVEDMSGYDWIRIHTKALVIKVRLMATFRTGTHRK